VREAPHGGFVLAWIGSGGRVFARRAALDGKLLDRAGLDLDVTGAHALGARWMPEVGLELAVVRSKNPGFELEQRQLSGGCGG
jgi:hypothetical protein